MRLEQGGRLVPHRLLEDFLRRDITQTVCPLHRLGHHPGEGTSGLRSPALYCRAGSACEDVPYNPCHVTVFFGLCQGLLDMVQERCNHDGGVARLACDRVDKVTLHP